MRVVVIVGTEKGAFLCTSGAERRDWQIEGLLSQEGTHGGHDLVCGGLDKPFQGRASGNRNVGRRHASNGSLQVGERFVSDDGGGGAVPPPAR